MAQNLNQLNLNQSLNPSAPERVPAKPAAKRLIPILLGGVGLVLLGGGGILMELNSKLTTLQTSAQQKEAEVSSNQQIAHRYQTTLLSYNETQAHLNFLEASVSGKSYVPTLLAQLQALATQTHLTVSAVRPAPPTPPAAPVAAAPAADGSVAVVKKAAPPPYDTLDLAVEVSGSYADTSTFLYSLTRFPKIISVDSIQMHPGQSAVPGGPMIIMTSMKLTAFMFHDSAATTQPAGYAAATPAVSSAPPLAPPANGSVAGAAGRAAFSAAAAATQANTRSEAVLKTL